MSSNPKWKHLMNWKYTNKWQGFDKNPQNINKKWQPRKWISIVNKELREMWYEPARKQDIEENYMNMINLSEDDLINLWKDKEQPMLVRVLAKNILGWKWFDIIERMLDRWIWKPTQREENRFVDGDGNDVDITPNIIINNNPWTNWKVIE